MEGKEFAILSSFLFALSHVTAKRGLKNTSIVAGAILSLFAAAVVAGAALALDSSRSLSGPALLWFALAGLAGAGIGRAATIMAIDRLGPSTSAPIQGSVYPAFALISGVVFLHETVEIAHFFGVVAIIAGVIMLSRSSGIDARRLGSANDARKWGASTRAIALPLLAGLCFAASDTFLKLGTGRTPSAAAAALVQTLAGLLAWTLVLCAFRTVRHRAWIGVGASWFVLSGAAIAGAILSLARALRTADVSEVSPIVAAQPIGVLVLSALLLRGVERLTLRIIGGSASVVVGTLLIVA